MDITRKEKAAFAVAGAGQNMVNTLVGTFLLTYMYSSAVGLTAKGVAALGVFMTASKIWDAVNDPIMGVVVDKTHTRFGKLRPYILITAVPIAVLTTHMKDTVFLSISLIPALSSLAACVPFFLYPKQIGTAAEN